MFVQGSSKLNECFISRVEGKIEKDVIFVMGVVFKEGDITAIITSPAVLTRPKVQGAADMLRRYIKNPHNGYRMFSANVNEESR